MERIAHFIHGGGFVMYPLLFLSFVAVFVIVERLIAFRKYGAVSQQLLSDTLKLAGQERYGEAEAMVDANPGPLAACLSVILRHRALPTRETERLVEEAGQEYFLRLERFLPILDTTTTISPLLGLLGTIMGMIGAFNAIAAQTQHGNTDSVLAGVGEALYATATGLVIAVVCFAAYNYFGARLRSITAQTEQGATKLLNVLLERRHIDHAESLDSRSESQRGKGDGHAVQAAHGA
jgi:biopolymer transport protein ExbB